MLKMGALMNSANLLTFRSLKLQVIYFPYQFHADPIRYKHIAIHHFSVVHFIKSEATQISTGQFKVYKQN